MKIKSELIREYVADMICRNIPDLEIDEDSVADSVATLALAEIQEVLHQYELDDFEIVDEIVQIFYKYNLDAGACHDFG